MSNERRIFWYEKLNMRHHPQLTMDDIAKGGMTQFQELFTVIPCEPEDFKRYTCLSILATFNYRVCGTCVFHAQLAR